MTDTEVQGLSKSETAEDKICSRVSPGENEETSNDKGPPILIKMIGGKPLVWRATDWLKLKKHRIQGSLIGTPASFPKQTAENGLPLLLIPEEVTLILEKNLGVIFKYKENIEFPSEEIKKNYEEYLERSKKEQTDHYRDVCKEQIEGRIDSILEGKRRKLMMKRKKEGEVNGGEEQRIDREAMVESELERKLAAATSAHLIQIPTASPFITDNDLTPFEWKYPETTKQKIKYRVYKDLYEQGYTLTPGVKFGGDFLAYAGEPSKFHAFFIIICLEYNEEVKVIDLISNARLGVFTRKNLVLASVDEEDNVQYNTLSWPHSF